MTLIRMRAVDDELADQLRKRSNDQEPPRVVIGFGRLSLA